MRHTAFLRRFALAVFVIIVSFLPVSGFVDAARGAPLLTLDTETPLSAQSEAVVLSVEGAVEGSWPDAFLEVSVSGPAPPDATERPGWRMVEELPIPDLSDRFEVSAALPPESMEEPGAYLVEAKLRSGSDNIVSTDMWLGRFAPSSDPLQISVVWPAALGPHRDPQGVFVDDIIQRSVIPSAAASGSLYALFALPERYPDWHFTIAVEPLLLEQIRDLSDGFQEMGEEGDIREIQPDDEVPVLAGQALDTFRRVVRLDGVEALPGPFAMPSLPVLAEEGWDDGTEQMRLGKREVQSTLELAVTPSGGYPPGLEITTDSLRYLSEASLDYAVVSEDVARDLAIRPSDGQIPVRATDGENHRLTLLFADEGLGSALGLPWDAKLFAAALAARWASGAGGPVVAAPATDYGIPPESFLRDVGEMLTRTPGVQTLSVDEMVREHPPESRPVFLSRYGGHADGFVSRSYRDTLRETQQAVAAFARATTSDRAPVDRLKLLLFQGESRYWLEAGADAGVANRGLSYLNATRDMVAEEFDKVDLADEKSVLFFGKDGEVPVAVVNRSGYPMDVVLEASGQGLDFQDGRTKNVSLGIQENVFPFAVTAGVERTTMQVRVTAGGRLVDEAEVEIRVLSAGVVAFWAAAGIVVLGLAVVLVLRLRRVVGEG